MNTRDRQILEKIVVEISYLEELLEGVTEAEFLENEMMRRAAAMTSINIGELAKHLSKDFFERYPDSDLKQAAKTRDVYAHGYMTLSFSMVYKTAFEDYPRLRVWIDDVIGND